MDHDLKNLKIFQIFTNQCIIIAGQNTQSYHTIYPRIPNDSTLKPQTNFSIFITRLSCVRPLLYVRGEKHHKKGCFSTKLYSQLLKHPRSRSSRLQFLAIHYIGNVFQEQLIFQKNLAQKCGVSKTPFSVCVNFYLNFYIPILLCYKFEKLRGKIE